MSSYILRDAVEVNAAHPDTFQIPQRESILSLRPGDFVKLIFINATDGRGERMWVRITATGPDGAMVGELDNVAVDETLPRRGTKIPFTWRHVIQLEVAGS